MHIYILIYFIILFFLLNMPFSIPLITYIQLIHQNKHCIFFKSIYISSIFQEELMQDNFVLYSRLAISKTVFSLVGFF